MNSPPSDGPADDSHDPVALHIAASGLDVYQRERLAYTEIPPRRSKSRPATNCVNTLPAAIYYWVCSRS
jgi:hypothetical protein